MANERQGKVVDDARSEAHALAEIFVRLDEIVARYDELNLENPNFAAGFFGSTQEITANALLGFFNSWNGLKAAAPNQIAALRAAARKIRSQ